jgi:hypothetical protein
LLIRSSCLDNSPPIAREGGGRQGREKRLRQTRMAEQPLRFRSIVFPVSRCPCGVCTRRHGDAEAQRTHGKVHGAKERRRTEGVRWSRAASATHGNEQCEFQLCFPSPYPRATQQGNRPRLPRPSRTRTAPLRGTRGTGTGTGEGGERRRQRRRAHPLCAPCVHASVCLWSVGVCSACRCLADRQN